MTAMGSMPGGFARGVNFTCLGPVFCDCVVSAPDTGVDGAGGVAALLTDDDVAGRLETPGIPPVV